MPCGPLGDERYTQTAESQCHRQTGDARSDDDDVGFVGDRVAFVTGSSSGAPPTSARWRVGPGSPRPRGSRPRASSPGGIEHLGEGVALHVGTEIAGPDEVDLGEFHRDVVAHRALRDEGHLTRTRRLQVGHHARRGADVVGLGENFGRALGMGDDEDARNALAEAADVGAGEAFVDFAAPLPADDAHGCLAFHIASQVAVGKQDHLGNTQRFDHLDGIRGRAADVGLGLDVGGGVHVGDDRDSGVLRPELPDVLDADGARERAAGLEVGDQNRLPRIQDLRGLGHEVDATQDDDVGVHPRRLPGEAEGIAPDVGDAVIDLGCLVVVRQDDSVAFPLPLGDGMDEGGVNRPLDLGDGGPEARAERLERRCPHQGAGSTPRGCSPRSILR